MVAILQFIDRVLIELLIWIIIIGAVMSWLFAFNVINPHNQFVRTVWEAINRLTEPMIRPIRRRMPDLGGVDLSPMVLILLLILIRYIINIEILPRLA